MEFIDFVLYGLWSLVPLFFFGMWLWCTLERLSKQKVEMDTNFLMRQAGFTLLCFVMTLLLDIYWLKTIEVPFLQETLPHWFWRILLFPIVLYVMARVVGPTKKVQISKAPPRVGHGDPRSKGR